MSICFIYKNGKGEIVDESKVRSYRKHSDSIEEQLFFLVYEKSMTPRASSRAAGESIGVRITNGLKRTRKIHQISQR